jgi:hypothetical protein
MKVTSAYTKPPFLVKLKVHLYYSRLVVFICKAKSLFGAGTSFVSSMKILIANMDGGRSQWPRGLRHELDRAIA